jgi:hypothetical protein
MIAAKGTQKGFFRADYAATGVPFGPISRGNVPISSGNVPVSSGNAATNLHEWREQKKALRREGF